MRDPKQLQSHYAVINYTQASQGVFGPCQEEEQDQLETIRVTHFCSRDERNTETLENKFDHEDGEGYLVSRRGSGAGWKSRERTGTSVLTWRPQQSGLQLALAGSLRTSCVSTHKHMRVSLASRWNPILALTYVYVCQRIVCVLFLN